MGLTSAYGESSLLRSSLSSFRGTQSAIKPPDLRSFIKTYLDVLRASKEFGSIWRGLDLPPSLMVHILRGGGLGLGRRVSLVSSREAQGANPVSFYCE